jgi:hypothetical protein
MSAGPKHSKAVSPSHKAKGTKQKPSAKFVPITMGHPAAPRALEIVNEYMRVGAEPAPRKKPEPRITLAGEKLRDVQGELEGLSSDFAAIRRLSWAIQDWADEDSDAAAKGLEALCTLSGLKADYLVRKIGGLASGNFQDELNRYMDAKRAPQ